MPLNWIIIGSFLVVASFILGYALYRSGTVNPRVIIAQMQGLSLAILRVFLTASITSLTLILLLDSIGIITFHPTYTLPLANVLGGVLIGVGLVLISFWPAREQEGEVGWAGLLVFFCVLVGVKLAIKSFYLLYPHMPHRFFLAAGKPTLHEVVNIPFYQGALGLLLVMGIGLYCLRNKP